MLNKKSFITNHSQRGEVEHCLQVLLALYRVTSNTKYGSTKTGTPLSRITQKSPTVPNYSRSLLSCLTQITDKDDSLPKQCDANQKDNIGEV